MAIKNSTPYRNLPPLAGVASFNEASKPRLSVDESVARLTAEPFQGAATGVVSGIAHYGNCIGVPTIGGEG